jgi:hypothetical protein
MGERNLPNKQGNENVVAMVGLYSKLYPESPDRAAGYSVERVADAVYWLAHGDGGRPLMRRSVLELALAGGLLAELAFADKIGLYDATGTGVADRVCVVYNPLNSGCAEYSYDRERPADAVGRYVYDQIMSDESLTLDMWLSVLRTVTLRKVREERLGLAPLPRGVGLLCWNQTALPRAPRIREADRAWSAVTLRIRRRAQLSTADAFLIGLGLATGLGRHLLEGALPDQRRHAEAAVERLPDLLAQVVGHTEAATARTAVRPRL